MSRKNAFQVLTSPVYLLALAVLLLNDHVLKELAPGFVTGKLSDFAGLFACAAFWAGLFPRRALAVCGAVGGLFILWKSPWAGPWIASWNALGVYPLARVADPGDLVALGVLPLAYRLSVHPPVTARRPAAAVAVSLLSLVAFAATSRPHADFEVPPDDPLRHLEFHGSLRQSREKLESCGYYFLSQAEPLRESRWRSHIDLDVPAHYEGKEQTFYLSGTVQTAGKLTILDIKNGSVPGPEESMDDPAVLREIERKLRACLGAR